MDKNFMVFIALGVGALYFVTNSVKDIQEGDPALQSEEYKEKHQFDGYQKYDSIGQSILDVVGADSATQIKAWDNSSLKREFLTFFPNFEDMYLFIDERVRGDEFKNKLTQATKNIEYKFSSGSLDAEGAKRMLRSIK